VFNTSSALTVGISGMKITGGAFAGNGGGIINQGEALTLTDVNLTGNAATGTAGRGAGFFVSLGGGVTLVNSTVSGNTAGDDGGAGYFNGTGGTLVIQSTTISGNTAGAGTANDGGGFYLQGAVAVTIENSTLAGNAAGRGGALAIKTATAQVTIRNSTIVGNSALAPTGTNSSGGITRTVAPSTGYTTLVSSIVALNTGGTTNGADFSIAGGALNADFSLIGASDGLTITGANNLTGTHRQPAQPDARGAPEQRRIDPDPGPGHRLPGPERREQPEQPDHRPAGHRVPPGGRVGPPTSGPSRGSARSRRRSRRPRTSPPAAAPRTRSPSATRPPARPWSTDRHSGPGTCR